MELPYDPDEFVADRHAEIMDCLEWYNRYHDRDHVTWQWPTFFYDRCACGSAAESFYPLIFDYPDTSDDLANDPADDPVDDLVDNPVDNLADEPVVLPLHGFWTVPWNYENCTLSPAGGGFTGAGRWGSSGLGGGMAGGAGGAGGGGSGGFGSGGPGLLLDEPVDLQQPHPELAVHPVPLPAAGLMFPAALIALGWLGWVRRRARVAS